MTAMEIRFTQAARRHRIGRTAVRHVLAHASPTGTTTEQGSPAWLYVGRDDRDRELEIIAVEIDDERFGRCLLVIHVMPTELRGGHRHA